MCPYLAINLAVSGHFQGEPGVITVYNGNGMAETPVDIGMAGAPFSNGVADASLNNGAAHASVNGVADAPFHNGVANALVPDRESQPSGSANGSLDGVADAPFNGGVAGAPFHGVADADGPFHNGVADAPADGVGADAPDPVTNPRFWGLSQAAWAVLYAQRLQSGMR